MIRDEAGVDYRAMHYQSSKRRWSVARWASRFPGWSRLTILLVVLVAPALNCTCADWEYRRAYDAHVTQQLDRHGYGDPEVAQQATAIVRDRGYVFEDGESTTAWKTDGDEARSRYRIDLRPGDGGTSVRFFREDARLSEQQWERDSRARVPDLERALLVRIAPERAKSLDDAQVAQFVYDVPAARLWGEAAVVLPGADAGLYDTAAPVDSISATRWKMSAEGRARTRHEVRLATVEHRQYKVEIHETRERAAGDRRWLTGTPQRDMQLEFDLLRRVDPGRAEAIETEARVAGQAAFDDAVSRGAPSCGCG